MFDRLLHILQTNPAVFVFFIAVISACVGSFINVVAYRLPLMRRGEKLGINFPASHCPKCKTALKFWHNIPLLSYLFLGGKCAFCKVHIPWRYFLVELISMLGGVVIGYMVGFQWLCLPLLLVFWLLLAVMSACFATSLNA